MENIGKNSLLSLQREVLAIDASFAEARERFKKFETECIAKKRQLLTKITFASHSLDIGKMERGQELLVIQFPACYCDDKKIFSPVYGSLIDAAVADLVSGAKQLSRQYIGQKRYEAYDQRCDCEYGMGPFYGYIYQRIGLAHPQQKLSDEDIEACLYLLANLDIVLKTKNDPRVEEK